MGYLDCIEEICKTIEVSAVEQNQLSQADIEHIIEVSGRAVKELNRDVEG